MSTHRLKHGSVVDAAKTKAHKGGTSLEKTESLTGEIRALDLFCGAGGSSWGAQQAGVEIVAAFDLWDLAGKNHQTNFPSTRFYPGRLEDVNLCWQVVKMKTLEICASPQTWRDASADRLV
jgi:hypothetical protein